MQVNSIALTAACNGYPPMSRPASQTSQELLGQVAATCTQVNSTRICITNTLVARCMLFVTTSKAKTGRSDAGRRVSLAEQCGNPYVSTCNGVDLFLSPSDMKGLCLDTVLPAHAPTMVCCANNRVNGEVWAIPTRLALALSGGSSREVQQGVAEGYVIVETNYRVGIGLHCTEHCTVK